MPRFSIRQGKENLAITGVQQGRSHLVGVFNTIGSRGIKLGLLAQDSLAPTEYKDYCQVTLELFREIRKLPRHESIGVLRYLYSLGGR